MADDLAFAGGGRHYVWVDETPPIPVDMLSFESTQSSTSRYVSTAWLPYDDEVYKELYRQIITQMKWIKGVIDSPSLVMKRSREAANALHISSGVQEDVHAAEDLVTELVNFRIRSQHNKLKRKPLTDFVNAFNVNNYNGESIVGERSETNGKNFVVSLAELYNCKIAISYPDMQKIRVAILGKLADSTRARAQFEKFIEEMGEGADEKAAQAAALVRAAEEVAAPTIKVLRRSNTEEQQPNDLVRLPSNVVAACEVLEDEKPTESPQNTDAAAPSRFHGFSPAPFNTFSQHPFGNFHQPVLNNLDHMFIHTFTTAFTQAFAHAMQTATVKARMTAGAHFHNGFEQPAPQPNHQAPPPPPQPPLF